MLSLSNHSNHFADICFPCATSILHVARHVKRSMKRRSSFPSVPEMALDVVIASIGFRLLNQGHSIRTLQLDGKIPSFADDLGRVRRKQNTEV